MTPFPIRHILAATDFSDSSKHSVDVAIELAKRFDADLSIVHSYTIPVSAYDYATGLLWPIDDLSQAAQNELDRTVAAARKAWPRTKGVLAAGDPWERVIEASKVEKADLLVLGTHGRRGISHMLLGSVAEKVVRLSQVPVLTVPSPAAG